jgi:hypothetical protein
MTVTSRTSRQSKMDLRQMPTCEMRPEIGIQGPLNVNSKAGLAWYSNTMTHRGKNSALRWFVTRTDENCVYQMLYLSGGSQQRIWCMLLGNAPQELPLAPSANLILWISPGGRKTGDVNVNNNCTYLHPVPHEVPPVGYLLSVGYLLFWLSRIQKQPHPF